MVESSIIGGLRQPPKGKRGAFSDCDNYLLKKILSVLIGGRRLRWSVLGVKLRDIGDKRADIGRINVLGFWQLHERLMPPLRSCVNESLTMGLVCGSDGALGRGFCPQTKTKSFM